MIGNNYGHNLDANPFADPATANPFGSHGNESAFSLESVGNGGSSRQPTGGVENIGAYVADHDRRAQELEAKQRELERREAELQQREAEVAQYKPNWPPCELLGRGRRPCPSLHHRTRGPIFARM